MREDNGMCLWCGPHQHREGSLRWWWSADWDLKAGEKEHSQLSVQLEGSRKTLGLERARAERPSAGSAQRAVTFGKRRIKAVQLTLERHRFELHGSIYMLTVANKYCSNSTIHSWLKLQMRISGEDYKFTLGFLTVRAVSTLTHPSCSRINGSSQLRRILPPKRHLTMSENILSCQTIWIWAGRVLLLRLRKPALKELTAQRWVLVVML